MSAVLKILQSVADCTVEIFSFAAGLPQVATVCIYSLPGYSVNSKLDSCF